MTASDPSANRPAAHSNQHPCRDAGDVTITSFGLNASEQSILDIVRLLCISFAHPPSQSWEMALQVSIGRFGFVNGSQIFAGTMKVMQEMRVARKTTFKFVNPHCKNCKPKLSECEQRLMGIMKGARTGGGERLQTDCMILCEGSPSDAFIASIYALVRMFPGPTLDENYERKSAAYKLKSLLSKDKRAA